MSGNHCTEVGREGTGEKRSREKQGTHNPNQNEEIKFKIKKNKTQKS